MAPQLSKKRLSTKNKTKKTKKTLPPAPLKLREVKKKVIQKHPFIEKRPKNFRIGGNVLPKTDLTRFVRWPKYIVLQRQKSILLKRLKIPPALNQFQFTIDKNQASQLLRLMSKYKPETRQEKKKRLLNTAKNQADGKPLTTKKPVMLKYGLNHVVDLIEMKKARLVVIAHDVVPLENVCWLPTLCRKKDIPFCIIKGKSRLGQLVHKKNAVVVAIDNVRKEDQAELELLCKNFRAQFNENVELRRRWGGGINGIKSIHAQEKKEKLIAMEKAKKLGFVR